MPQQHCIECGKLLAESAKFCWSCGSEIQSAVTKPVVAPAEPVRRKKIGYGVVAVVVAVIGLVALSVSSTALRDFVQTVVSSRNTDDRSAVRVEPGSISGLHARAEQGDVAAQLILVDRYSLGLGVPRNISQAIYWAELAAEEDDRGQIKLDRLIGPDSLLEEQSSEPSPGFIPPAAGMSIYDTRELLDEQEALEIGEFRVATFTLYPDSGMGQRLQISFDGAPLTLATTYSDAFMNLGGSEFHTIACNSDSKFTNGTDFTGNGIPDVYVGLDSGGSAGFAGSAVLELSSGSPLSAGKRLTGATDPDVRELYSVSQADCLIDIDGDGIFEIEHADDNYQEWGGFKHSPAPSQLLRWTGEAYEVDFSLAAYRRIPTTSTLANLARTVKAAIIDPNTEEWSVGRYANGFENVELASLSRWALNLLYAGNWEETWTFIDNAWPEARPGKDAYLEKFLETVTTSTFGPFILARRGYSKAQDVVGHKYWLGNAGYGSRGDIAGEEVYPVVKRDLVLAHFWLSQAASGGTVEFSTERTQGQNSSAPDWPPAQFDASDKLTADRDYYDVLIETSGARHVAAVSDELSVLETEMTADQIDLAKRLRDGCRRPNTLSSIEKTYVNLNLEGVTCD